MDIARYAGEIGIDRGRTIGEQLQRNAEAIKRAKNAKNAQEAVKDVNLGNLEQKHGGNAGKPRIDYAALRAKMNRMQNGPRKQVSSQNSYAM